MLILDAIHPYLYYQTNPYIGSFHLKQIMNMDGNMSVKYQVPNAVNKTPITIIETHHIKSMEGFARYIILNTL